MESNKVQRLKVSEVERFRGSGFRGSMVEGLKTFDSKVMRYTNEDRTIGI